jgi:hypothetical protein
MNSKDSALLNKRLVAALDKAVSSCERAYAGKARSFAVILTDLEMVLSQLQNKMNFGEDELCYPAPAGTKAGDVNCNPELGDSEKLVYVRVFHKDMPQLLVPKSSLTWMQSLLNSIKTAEKHGLAVYAHEEEVIRSIRGAGYGYATLRIHESQDITSKRPLKTDPNIGCSLLTIAPVEINCFTKFTYVGVDYPFKEGVMRRPMVKVGEEAADASD